MKEYSFRSFERILKKNGYRYQRTTGSHYIYKGKGGEAVVVPYHLKAVISNKIIRENNLVIS